MKVYVLFDDMDARLIGIYTDLSIAEERLEEQWRYHLDEHPCPPWTGFSKDQLEIIEVETDEDMEF